MQTAVEWLGNEIKSRITRENPHDTIIIQTQGEILIELIEQAKEMEKEQRKQEYLKGMKDANELRITQEIQLFKESFKSE